MRFSLVAAALSAAAAVSAADVVEPFMELPLTNGFPSLSLSASSLKKIQYHAGGVLPDGALPTKISKTAAATFQLVALQEIFEAAYFSSLLKNITNEVEGYKTPYKKYMMRTFRRIRAQEESHALGANFILKNTGQTTISGCKYVFPVSTLDDAIALAQTFTDVVLGVIPQVQALMAADGGQEVGLIPLLGSILGQEGEQVGWFRSYQEKVPSAAPFLTPAFGGFAASALTELFLVKGSCNFIPDVPTTPVIAVSTTPEPKNMMLEMTTAGTVTNDMYVQYISGQHSPIMGKISGATTKDGATTFMAEFPYTSGISNGLTIAAVTKKPKYDSAVDVSTEAVFGPGLIELH